MADRLDTEVLIIGSGFGGSVAALRFAESGHSVTILERGAWVTRESNEVDFDSLWDPARHRYGMNEIRQRGRNIIPWVGAAVGGGSHVYAGSMKRAEHFEGFPTQIARGDLEHYYERAESMMDAQHFPDHAPYNAARATQLLYDVGRRLKAKHPDLVEATGPINLAISFAPEGVSPGTEFTNKHGARQRYSDPHEQSLLGGDIDAKNTLDKNYLHKAQQAGAVIRPLTQATRIEPLEGGGYRVHFERWIRETSAWRRIACRWIPGCAAGRETGSITCRRLVVSAGCIGSTELLLRSRDVHRTLPELSPALGTRYSSNGDFVSLIFPFRGLFVSWLGFFAALVGLCTGVYGLAIGGAVAYFAGLLVSRRPFDPDIGTTNSDYIRFKGEDGASQGAYIESGRYPTPVRLTLAVMLSSVGLWRPRRYARIIRFTNLLRAILPPFAALARTWPVPLLKMGRDRAVGTFVLDDEGHACIDFPVADNAPFYAYLNRLGRLVAKEARAYWAPNLGFRLLKKLEVPHNQGGTPMGEGPEDGVVDHAGRVFGYDDLVVLDGSILPRSPGPNPALTILAVSERAMQILIEQLESEGVLRATP